MISRCRRIGVLFFLVILSIAVYRTNLLLGDNSADSRRVTVYGTVTNIDKKDFSTEVSIDRNKLVRFKKKKNNKDISKFLEVGDKVRVYGVEKNIYSLNFKGFDYGRLLLSKGYKAYIEGSRYEVCGENIFYKYLGYLKKYIIESNYTMYGEYSYILNALLVGYKKDLTKEQGFLFTDSGTSHLMAISGLHVAIIAGIILLFLGGIHNIRGLVFVYTILTLYSFLVSKSPSVERAVNVFLFIYVAYFLDERFDIINILSIIAGIMIVNNIFIIYNISFQLSFLTIASIGIYKKYIDKVISFDFISITLSSMVLTLPIILYYFKEVSIMGFFGNLLIIPFIGVLIIFDLISILLYWMNIGMYKLIVLVTSGIIDFMTFTMEKIGNYGVNNIVVKEESIGGLIIYYLIVAVVSLFLYWYMINKNKRLVDE